MPDFNTRQPREPNEPNRLGIRLVANRLRTLLIANKRRTLLIGGGILLLVVAVPVGLLIYSSSGMGDNPLNVEAANSKPLTGQCRGAYRNIASVDYSPNGQKIVFLSSYHYPLEPGSASATASVEPGTSRDEADYAICVVNADGTGMVRLTDNSMDEYSPVWSPDGKKIAFIRYIWDAGNPRSPIVTMNADGSNEVKLPGTEQANWGVPRALDWSPDGDSIAFNRACNIYITLADGSGTPRDLTSDPAWQCSKNPAWSPDGKWIAFESVRDPRAIDGPYIYVMNALGEGDTEQWRQLTDDPANFPAWSPDGTEIAFNKTQPWGTVIYKVDTDGSKETRLSSGVFPTWLPDGKHIAYLDKGGIYKMNSDGSNPTLVVGDEPERTDTPE